MRRHRAGGAEIKLHLAAHQRVDGGTAAFVGQIADSAYIAGPLRPALPRLRCSCSVNALIAVGSRPTHSGPSMESITALVALNMRLPKPSPQPLTPSSVSMRTSSVLTLVRGVPPGLGTTLPSMTIGMLKTMVSTLVIFIDSLAFP